MPDLEPFWKWFESRASRTALLIEWRAHAGAAMAALHPMLRPVERRATAYPNPRNSALPLRIVRHGDGSIVAVDDSDWQNRVPLRPDDVVLYQLDLRALRKALCDALDGVNIVRTPVDQATHCLQIGNWEPKKAASFPVYLLLCQSRGILHQHVLDLQSRCTRPGAILLTPTRTNWDADLESMARSRRLLLATISEILDLDGHSFRETPFWQEYLQAFCQVVKLTLPSNYRNKRPMPMRGHRAANIEKLEKEMEAHLIAARDKAHSLNDQGLEPVLLPRPKQKELAEWTGLSKSDVCRCLNDPRAKVLKMLWRAAESVDGVMSFKRRH